VSELGGWKEIKGFESGCLILEFVVNGGKILLWTRRRGSRVGEKWQLQII
jgi:hypothetical protein